MFFWCGVLTIAERVPAVGNLGSICSFCGQMYSSRDGAPLLNVVLPCDIGQSVLSDVTIFLWNLCIGWTHLEA